MRWTMTWTLPPPFQSNHQFVLEALPISWHIAIYSHNHVTWQTASGGPCLGSQGLFFHFCSHPLPLDSPILPQFLGKPPYHLSWKHLVTPVMMTSSLCSLLLSQSLQCCSHWKSVRALLIYPRCTRKDTAVNVHALNFLAHPFNCPSVGLLPVFDMSRMFSGCYLNFFQKRWHIGNTHFTGPCCCGDHQTEQGRRSGTVTFCLGWMLSFNYRYQQLFVKIFLLLQWFTEK